MINAYIFLLISLCPLLIKSQDLSTYEKRKEAVLESLKDVKLDERGKHGLPKAIARLHYNPQDSVALNYITNILDHPNQSMFDFPGVALALCRYRDSFTDYQISQIKSDLERLAKPDKRNGEGFLGHGTENHATVMWCSGYLFGQLFPDAQWANGMTSQELMAEMKERLRKTFKNIYDHGYTEYLSTTYETVMNFPVEILLEYAKDTEVRSIAEAYLLYKWSIISLNNFEGYVIAPYGRMNTDQYFKTEEPVSGANYYNWLFWGWGERTDFVDLMDFQGRVKLGTTYTIYSALSNIIPNGVFFKIANGMGVPYSLKSSGSTFGEYGSGAPHMMMRNVYRDSLFAIGTGNFRWVPGGDYADHDTNGFSIVWQSQDNFNYIGCFHPYWYSDGDMEGRTPETWHKGNISPFQQTAHHKNTVITVFNIPDKDPWEGLPSPSKWLWRDGHASDLVKRGMLRYPKSVDEKVEKNNWIFLREGDVYIGIRPLKDYYEQTNLTGKGLDNFNVIKSDYSKTGFVFELGTKMEFNDFEAFQRNLIDNNLDMDWNKMTFKYTDSQGDHIQIQYLPGLQSKEEYLPNHLKERGFMGLMKSVPKVIINGEQSMEYNDWPMIESPCINMNHNYLKIEDSYGSITVDWTKDYPVINKNL